MDYTEHNRQAWNHYVGKGDRWTVPVPDSEVEEARKGRWGILLTPSRKVPRDWFPELQGLEVLALASGGGQQGPILAAGGARVTVFDQSERQLGQDEEVAGCYGLSLRTVRGDMRDLSVFPDASFDLVFNPCSVVFIEEVGRVWRECHRVLRPGGVLMTGLINPLMYQLQNRDGSFVLAHSQPYSDLRSLPPEERDRLIREKEPLEFGHGWTAQIGGQLEAGFCLTHMYEDHWGGGHEMDGFFPPFMATRAVKTAWRPGPAKP